MPNIPSSIFDDTGVTNLVLGEHVTTIGDFAFDANPLTSITNGNNSVSIGDCAFGENPPLDESFASNYTQNCHEGK